jgi:hypothetical protein
MSIFSEIMNDRVTLIKPDGQTFHDIICLVTPDAVTTDDADAPIEDGDHFERLLPNGVVEKYRVLHSGFTKGLYQIPDHYQCKVKKVTEIPRSVPAAKTVYNIRGHNARVNNGSIDNSTNTVHEAGADVFEAIARVLREQMPDSPSRTEVLALVSEMQKTKGTPSFGQVYVRFMAGAADHMTVLAPLLGALAAHLTK